jgi:hypothetical protein
MTVRFMLGLGFGTLGVLLLLGALVYGVSYARKRSLHRKRRWRRRGQKLRIHEFMAKPDGGESGEP